MNKQIVINKPPVLHNQQGEIRKVGYELEFAALELEEVAQIIKEIYGGDITEKSRYEYDINGSSIGNFRVELDARILQKMASQDILSRLGLDLDRRTLRESFEDVVDKLAKKVVPVEVVMPPVPIEELHRLEQLRKKLQESKAEGTSSSFVHAFGMHINIETPDLEVETLLRYLRSFLLVYPWLVQVLEIDFSRRLSPFVDPFPDVFVQMILSPDYEPDRDTFLEDYLQFNATRNRPLDMLPIFAILTPERISEATGDEKNNPRSTFHYRLPNSRIDDADWTFADEWNKWCVIERLAGDDEMIAKLSELYLLRKKKAIVSFKKEWAETVSILLELDSS